MLNKKFPFSLKKLIKETLKIFQENLSFDFSETSDAIYAFLKDRLANILIDDGFNRDTIAAIISVSADFLPDVLNRIKALKKLRAEPDFEQIAVTFKRVVNIINKSAKEEINFQNQEIDQNLFDHQAEFRLYSEYEKIKKLALASMEKGDFSQALYDMAMLREPVDVFFDNVMVMDKDLKLRNNRLALLSKISELFGTFADFSKIST